VLGISEGFAKLELFDIIKLAIEDA